MVNIDGEATTQVLESIQVYIYDKQFYNSINLYLTNYGQKNSIINIQDLDLSVPANILLAHSQ